MRFILLLQKFLVDIIRSTRNIKCIWHVSSADNYLTFYQIYNIYYKILNIKCFCTYSVNAQCLIFKEENLKRTNQKIPTCFQMRYEKKSFKNKQDESWKVQRVRVSKFINKKKAGHFVWKDKTKILKCNGRQSWIGNSFCVL